MANILYLYEWGVIKVQEDESAGRGYSFEAIREKMLFRADVRVRQKVPRRPSPSAFDSIAG